MLPDGNRRGSHGASGMPGACMASAQQLQLAARGFERLCYVLQRGRDGLHESMLSFLPFLKSILNMNSRPNLPAGVRILC